MSNAHRRPNIIWRAIRLMNRRVVSRIYLRRAKMGRLILLLTTIGRKSGQPRVTPLQYEEVDGMIYVGAARGQQADWFRNIIANPHVEIQVNGRQFRGLAEPITDPLRIADFLELRLQRHPRMVGAILLSHKLPMKPSRAQLEQLGTQLTIVAIRPCDGEGE